MPGGGSLTVAPNDATASAAWGQRGPAANPQQLNRYSYVLNNPLKSGDPTGHCIPGPLLVWCAVVVGSFITEVVIPAVVGAAVIAAAAEAGKQLGEAARAANADTSGDPVDVSAGDTNGANPQQEQKSTNPFGGPVDEPVIAVDPHGNAIPVNQGEQLTGSPNGQYVQVRDSAGNPTGTRLDGGHKPATHPDPRAQVPHAHIPGVTNTDGTPWLPVKGPK